MSKESMPWDQTFSESADIGALYPDSQEYSLSELDIAPPSRYVFFMGRPLAVLHQIGIIHGDLHSKQFALDNATGTATLFDFGASSHAELNPKSMIHDFHVGHANFEADAFHALLAGYVQESLLSSDLIYKNYTNELLALIGGKPLLVPYIEVDSLNVHDFIHKIGLNISIVGKHLQVGSQYSSILSKMWEDNYLDVSIYIVAAIIIGVDIILTLKVIVGDGDKDIALKNDQSPKTHLYKTLKSLYNRDYGDYIDEPRNDFPPDVRICSAFFQEMQHTDDASLNSASSSGNNEREQPNHTAAALLMKILSNFPTEESAKFIEKIIDFSDFFAKEIDSKSGSILNDSVRQKSVDFAQLSLMLLECCHDHPRNYESRALTSIRRHRQLSWYNDLFKNCSDIYKFFTGISYANAWAKSFLTMFSRSLYLAHEEKLNAYWSFYFRAMGANCWSISSLYDCLNEDKKSHSNIDVINQILKVITNLQIATLVNRKNALFTAFTMKEGEAFLNLAQEIAELVNFKKFLEHGSVSSKRGMELFGIINKRYHKRIWQWR